MSVKQANAKTNSHEDVDAFNRLLELRGRAIQVDDSQLDVVVEVSSLRWTSGTVKKDQLHFAFFRGLGK